MGIDQTELVLDPGRQGTLDLFPGETVSGKMVLHIGGSKPQKLNTVVVKIRGMASTDWSTGIGSSSQRFSETQHLLRLELPMLADQSGQPIAIPPGRRQFPFSFSLPAQLAHSQEHGTGHVRYECKARAIGRHFWSANGRADVLFRVRPLRDLSKEPHLARPLTVQREARRSLFGPDPGPFQVQVSRQGFVAGKVIDLWLDGPDQAFEVMAAANGTYAEVQLKVNVLCRADKFKTKKKRVLTKVCPGRSPSSWRHVQLTVPHGEVSMDDSSGCTNISITHYVKVRDVHVTVILGTSPLPPS